MKTVVYFDCMPSPLGEMVLASDGDALTGAWFEGQRHQPAANPAWQRGRNLPVLRHAAAELAEYFAGERIEFDLPLAPLGTPFQHAVWNAIADVPYGATIAYRELAARAGRPESIRAAGAATGRNPLSIIIPCHRIVAAGGALTGYAGGLARKRALLAHERAGPSQARVAAASAVPCQTGAHRGRPPPVLADAPFGPWLRPARTGVPRREGAQRQGCTNEHAAVATAPVPRVARAGAFA